MAIDFERGQAYVVERNIGKLRTGRGLLNGLDVVIRHFWDALGKKLDNPSETSGVFTVQYPEERMKLPEAFRNFPVLLYDDETGQELCTSCFQCERICPPQVIHMTQEKDPATGKAVPAVAEFLIEYDACMSCGLCAEVCPFDAIKMDHAFELSTDVHGGLTWNKEQLNRPISYYEQLAPTFWAEVKDGALKKLQGNVKRRSGLLGVAPQMVERIRARGGELPPATPQEAPRAAAVAPSPALEAAPPTAPVSAEDKAARLAAIRARNAAKAGGQETPTDASAPAAPEPTATTTPAPADEKAARLAAIRARNAAKAGGQNAPAGAPEVSVSATEPTAEAPAAPAESPITPTPADDKAARLAAIRARNAAKKTAAEPQDGEPA
jgi:NADH-quinone oxidoreductase subunit I